MPIAISCKTCGAKLKAPDNAIGRQVKCPKCQSAILVQAPPPQESSPPQERHHPPVVMEPTRLPPKISNQATPPQAVPVFVPIQVTVPASVPEEARTKNCPFCGEIVLAVAKKCKHCGETIDVALRAAEEAQRMAKIKTRETRREAPIYVTTTVSSSAAASAKSGGRTFSTCGCLLVLLVAGCAGLVMVTALGTSTREKSVPNEKPSASGSLPSKTINPPAQAPVKETERAEPGK